MAGYSWARHTCSVNSSLVAEISLQFLLADNSQFLLVSSFPPPLFSVFRCLSRNSNWPIKTSTNDCSGGRFMDICTLIGTRQWHFPCSAPSLLFFCQVACLSEEASAKVHQVSISAQIMHVLWLVLVAQNDC